LSFEEIQHTNTLFVNAASENVKPAIIITTETVNIDGQNIIVATIPSRVMTKFQKRFCTGGIYYDFEKRGDSGRNGNS